MIPPAVRGHRRHGLYARALAGTTTIGEIAATVESREQASGTRGFRLYGTNRHTFEQVSELAHIYLSLRRRYPGVHVGHLHLAAPLDGLLGCAPLHDPDQPTHGDIRLSRALASRRYREWLTRHYAQLNQTARRRGRASPVPNLAVGIPAIVLIHEFGHLLEAAMWNTGSQIGTAIYQALSDELAGSGHHLEQTQPAARTPALMQLPARHYPNQGRWPANRELRAQITQRLGRYAATNRDELFAETFCAVTVGNDQHLKDCWEQRVRPILAEARIARPH